MGLFGKKKEKDHSVTATGYGVSGTISRAAKAEFLPGWISGKLSCCICGREYYQISTSEVPEEYLGQFEPVTVYPCADCGRIYCSSCMREVKKCACKSKTFYVKPLECAKKGLFFNQED